MKNRGHGGETMKYETGIRQKTGFPGRALLVTMFVCLPFGFAVAGDDDDDQSGQSVELDAYQVGSPSADRRPSLDGLGDDDMELDREGLGFGDSSEGGFALDPEFGSSGIDMNMDIRTTSRDTDEEDRQVVEEDEEVLGADQVQNQDLAPISIEAPEYPRRAFRDGREGTVEVEFTVTADGTTDDIEVVNARPRGTFDRAAKEAVEEWRFQPQIEDGRPAEVRLRQTLEFTLD